MTEAQQTTGPPSRLPPHEGHEDFSLIVGGPLYQLYLRTRMARPPLDFLQRRVVVMAAIAWAPLLLLSALGGTLTGGAIKVPFLYDIETHIRFLLALPTLIIAEKVVHLRLRVAVRQFVDRGIVAAQDMPKFRTAIQTAMRFRNSIAVEIGLVVFVYLLGHLVWRSQVALGVATWYASPQDSGQALTPAGYWYAFASIPMFQFILLRWYLRLLLWFWLLWRVSRLRLHVIPGHPDRAGGLGFLGDNSAQAFALIVFAEGALLAGLIANRIFYDGQTLLAFKLDAVGLVLFFVFVILAPLAVFTPLLSRARQRGLSDYGTFATDYVRGFEERWIRGERRKKEELLGSADIQSLADLGSSYAVVREMRWVPFRLDTVFALVVAAAGPLVPLLLTMIPLSELVDRLVKMVF